MWVCRGGLGAGVEVGLVGHGVYVGVGWTSAESDDAPSASPGPAVGPQLSTNTESMRNPTMSSRLVNALLPISWMPYKMLRRYCRQRRGVYGAWSDKLTFCIGDVMRNVTR